MVAWAALRSTAVSAEGIRRDPLLCHFHGSHANAWEGGGGRSPHKPEPSKYEPPTRAAGAGRLNASLRNEKFIPQRRSTSVFAPVISHPYIPIHGGPLGESKMIMPPAAADDCRSRASTPEYPLPVSGDDGFHSDPPDVYFGNSLKGSLSLGSLQSSLHPRQHVVLRPSTSFSQSKSAFHLTFARPRFETTSASTYGSFARLPPLPNRMGSLAQPNFLAAGVGTLSAA